MKRGYLNKVERDTVLERWCNHFDFLITHYTSTEDHLEKHYIRIIGYCLDLAGRHKDEQGVRR